MAQMLFLKRAAQGRSEPVSEPEPVAYALVKASLDQFEHETRRHDGAVERVSRTPRAGEFFLTTGGKVAIARRDVPGVSLPILRPRADLLDEYQRTGKLPEPTPAAAVAGSLRRRATAIALAKCATEPERIRVEIEMLKSALSSPARFVERLDDGQYRVHHADGRPHPTTGQTFFPEPCASESAARAVFSKSVTEELHLLAAELDEAVEAEQLDSLTADMLKAVFADEKPADGEAAIGKTKSGKVVYASGADCKGFDDDDHAQAAKLHHSAHRHHQVQAETHEQMGGEDDDWRRSEEHHREAGRHKKLAEHHHAVAREHLIAGAHGGSIEIGLDGSASKLKPYGDGERAEAAGKMAKRTHHDHPGGVSERDRERYAKLGDG